MAMAFAEAEYVQRLDKVRDALAVQALDALVVTTPENICYLSGYWTPGYHVFQALVVRRDGDPFLIVRNIEVDNVTSRSWIDRYYPISNLDLALTTFCDALRAEGVERSRVGLEVDGARQLMLRTDLLGEALPAVNWVPSVGLADEFRATKSEAEIAYIRRAVAMAENALIAGAASLSTARTDSDVAAAVHAQLAAEGSEFTGSPPYVVAGAASAQSHAVHAGRLLAATEPVWLEVPASVERYHGVSSRIGGTAQLSDEARRCFDVSAAAVRAMLAVMRPGAITGDVDAAGRAEVDRHGMGERWKNRAAYSLGLSFPPGLGEGHIIDIKRDDRRTLKSGMVFHMIPILKVPGVGAIGCTETVLVTEDGAERLGKLDLLPLTPDTLP